jgi:Fe-S-cluster containining protein
MAVTGSRMVDCGSLKALVVEYTCEQNCMGHRGNSGGCCTLGPRDFIIGPVTDLDVLVAHVSRLWGRSVAPSEIAIDYDEGSALFPDRATWQNPAHYPALRVMTDHPRLPCRFYDLDKSRCSIHAVRPALCRRYECEFLTKTLERF